MASVERSRLDLSGDVGTTGAGPATVNLIFIRRTLTRRTSGQDYHSHRLVESRRDGA